MALTEDEEFEFRARAEQEAKNPSLIDRAKSIVSGANKLNQFTPTGMMMKEADVVQKGFDAASEKVAEFGGRKGYPKIGAAAGTAISMIPSVAGSFLPGPRKGPVQGPGSLMKGIMSQAESSSGSMPGSLEAAYKDPSLIFSKGTEAAKPLYQAASKELPYEQSLFKGLIKHGDIVDKAVETVDKGGTLKPTEALMARKSLDKAKKTFSSDAFSYYRDVFDKMAKGSEDISKADPLFKRGLMATSLRNVMPQNKLGGASAFKMGIAPALAGIGSVFGPAGAAVGAGAGAAALSPIVQGVGATAAGVASRTDPRLLAAFAAYLKSKGIQ